MKTQYRIKRIATNVRKWAEELQDQKLFWDNDLSGMCGIASYELFKRLRRAKLKPTMCFAYEIYHGGHAFIQCQNLVVDVTATQFTTYTEVGKDGMLTSHKLSHKPIEIRKIKEASQAAEFWRTSVKAISKTQILNEIKDWPDDEIHPDLIGKIL